MSICKAVCRMDGGTDTKDHGFARRGCGAVWGKIKNPALLYATVEPEAWERVRKFGPEPPEDDADRCLWILAAAWRAVQWLDRETLVREQLYDLRRFVTNLKSAATSLPSGFVIDAEEQLREDEHERAKPAGPELQASRAKKTTYVH